MKRGLLRMVPAALAACLAGCTARPRLPESARLGADELGPPISQAVARTEEAPKPKAAPAPVAKPVRIVQEKPTHLPPVVSSAAPAPRASSPRVVSAAPAKVKPSPALVAPRNVTQAVASSSPPRTVPAPSPRISGETMQPPLATPPVATLSQVNRPQLGAPTAPAAGPAPRFAAPVASAEEGTPPRAVLLPPAP